MVISIYSGLAGKDSFTHTYVSHATKDLSHLGPEDKIMDFWDASTLPTGWEQFEDSRNIPEHLQSEGVFVIQPLRISLEAAKVAS